MDPLTNKGGAGPLPAPIRVPQRSMDGVGKVPLTKSGKDPLPAHVGRTIAYRSHKPAKAIALNKNRHMWRFRENRPRK